MFSSAETLSPLFSIVTKKTREGIGLWEKCENCELIINRSGVDPQEVENYYNSTYFQKNSLLKDELLVAKEQFDARIDSVRRIGVYLKQRLNKNMRVFELGASTGELLFLLKDHVAYCQANEINKKYTLFIQSELNIESSFENYLEMNIDKKYDLIISINTIDHMYDPSLVVNKIHNDLNIGGYLYVEVPNDNQALKEYLLEPQRSMFKEFMYQKAHYYSFSYKTISKLLEQSGFKIIEKRSNHDYSLKNYLKWYFTGESQKQFKKAVEETDLFRGDTDFEKKMNKLFNDYDIEFKNLINHNKVGESISILAKKKNI